MRFLSGLRIRGGLLHRIVLPGTREYIPVGSPFASLRMRAQSEQYGASGLGRREYPFCYALFAELCGFVFFELGIEGLDHEVL